MRFNYRWLCEYLGFRPPLTELCAKLTMGGIEVEELIDLGAGSGRIVVGEVIGVEPHPNADKLRLAVVRASDDESGEPLRVVCGAPNLETKKRYPLALEGATLPGDFTIGKTKIRGVESRGMLCSGKELGISEDADGILELPEQYGPGEPFDALLDVKVTPNRPDCLSLFGIARDVAALMGRKAHYPRPQVEEALDNVQAFSRVDVEALDRCPRYMARVIREVEIGPSPLWLRRRLEAAGLRAINNAVDITNYVLLELGQPLHAFDLDRLSEKRIVVRLAGEGEKLKLLDDTELRLTPDDLVIADAERAHVLAGIMGGEESEVGAETRHILLECAQFEPVGVRRSSRRHGKATESSYRFERGIDRENMQVAIDRAAQLLAEICGGKVAKDTLDEAAPAPPRPKVSLEPARVNRLLGTRLGREEIARALSNLGFDLDEVSEQRISVTVPSFRLDVEQDVDLVEEIARVVGYEAIPYTMPSIVRMEVDEDPVERAAASCRDSLVASGLCEAITYSFVDPEDISRFQENSGIMPLPLLNPLSPDRSAMRLSLMPGLVRAASLNRRRRAVSVDLFEVGRVYRPRNAYLPLLNRARTAAEIERVAGQSSEIAVDEAVAEEVNVAAVLAGRRDAHWRTSGKGRPIDFYDIRGVAEQLLADLGIEDWQMLPAGEKPWLHPGRAGRIVTAGQEMLALGQLHPSVAADFDLEGTEVYVLTGSVAMLAAAAEAEAAHHRDLPNQPAIERDMAIVVNEDTSAEECRRVIREQSAEILESLKLFDIYRGEHLPQGKKSLAFQMVFRLSDRSLTDEEANEAVRRIVAGLESELGASIRN